MPRTQECCDNITKKTVFLLIFGLDPDLTNLSYEKDFRTLNAERPLTKSAVLASLQPDIYCHTVSQKTELSLNIDETSTTEYTKALATEAHSNGKTLFLQATKFASSIIAWLFRISVTRSNLSFIFLISIFLYH